MTSAELLLDQAVRSQATDVLLSPGTGMGNIHLRAGFAKVYSRPTPSEALEALCQEIFRLASMSESSPPHRNEVGSLSYGPVRVRVSRMSTESGSMVRLRLQVVGILEEAQREFHEGRYGGLEVRPFLRHPRGLILISGLPSAGKTSALSHLLSDLGAPLLVSEASEIGADSLNPSGREDRDILDWIRENGASRPVALDEMDERLRLRLGYRLAEDRLVLATLTAPTLAAGVQKLVAAAPQTERVLGVFQVSWDHPQDAPRQPRYVWFPLGDGLLGHCAVCGSPRPERGDCPNCGVPLTAYLDRAVLRHLNTPEGYRALERLEQEWRA